MKMKTIRRQIAGQHTRDGVTVPVMRTIATREPALPMDWQRIATSAAVGVVMVLTLGSVIWSTWSIGSILGGRAVGFVAATIFDLGWATALLLEYLSRYDRRKREFPKKLGMALLLVTMAAIFWHGYAAGSLAMGVVGAFVSAFAKMLWLGVMKHVNAELSEEDEQWVTAQVSAAQAKAAVATVRRQTARIEQRAALEHLAMEKERFEVAEAFGLGAVQIDEDSEQIAEESGKVADRELAPAIEPPTIADMAEASKTGVVRYVHRQHPELTAAEITQYLIDQGVDIKTEYVQQTLARTQKVEPEATPEQDAEIIELRK